MQTPKEYKRQCTDHTHTHTLTQKQRELYTLHARCLLRFPNAD